MRTVQVCLRSLSSTHWLLIILLFSGPRTLWLLNFAWARQSACYSTEITSDILWTGEGASHGIWCGEQVLIPCGAYLSSTFVRYVSSNQQSLYVRYISSSLSQPTSASFNRSLSLATDSTSPVSLFSTSSRGALMCPAKESLSPTSTSLFYDELLGWTTSPLTNFKTSWLVSSSLFRFALHNNSILRAGVQVSTTK